MLLQWRARISRRGEDRVYAGNYREKISSLFWRSLWGVPLFVVGVVSGIVGALGGLLFGFDTAVTAGTTQQLIEVFHLTPITLGMTVFIGLVGTVIGALGSGVLGQRIGGRESLRIMAILYTVSALGSAFVWNWDVLMFARFIGGLGIGGSSVLGPVYIAEPAPAKLRGRMVGLFQIENGINPRELIEQTYRNRKEDLFQFHLCIGRI